MNYVGLSSRPRSRPHAAPTVHTAKHGQLVQRNGDTLRVARKTPPTSATPSDVPTTASELPKIYMVRCYNCGVNGHVSRDCPKPRKPCSGCKSMTHSRGQYTVNPRGIAPVAETFRVEPTPCSPKANCFCEGCIVQRRPRYMFDRHRFVERLGPSQPCRTIKVRYS